MADFKNITESPSLYDDLEKKNTLEILEDINNEDHKIADAVQRVLPEIGALIDDILPCMERGGRIFYIGAGTSGRLGVLDASEIPPTYGMPPTLFVGLIAGGDYALRHPVENAEDIRDQAWEDMKKHDIGPNDSVIGIAASGTTPYVIGGLEQANKHGLVTGGITSNPGSPVAQVAKHAITTVVGPEYVTGSSRMKSGTAQKMVLNMISSTLMIHMGRVEGNKMVDMQLSNKKLVERGTRMLMEYYPWSHDEAQAHLLEEGSVRAVLDKFPRN